MNDTTGYVSPSTTTVPIKQPKGKCPSCGRCLDCGHQPYVAPYVQPWPYSRPYVLC